MQARGDLQAEHDMLATVRDRVVMMLRQGKSLAEVKAAAPTVSSTRAGETLGTFLESTYVGLVRHTHELGAILLTQGH